MPDEFIPLVHRVCHELLAAGTLDPDGKLPKCLGRQCSRYESCIRQILESTLVYNDLIQNPAHIHPPGQHEGGGAQ